MRIALISAAVLLAACGGNAGVQTHTSAGTSGSAGSSGSRSAGSTGTTTTGGSTSGTSAGSTTTTSGGSGGSSGTTDGCSDAAKLVYVVDVNNKFYAFHPGTAPTFTQIGTLNCPASGGATPFSMSVDRTATAWVLYSDGEIFKVSTSNASCTATNYQPGQHGFTNFGMGFVTDTNGGTTDTLYLAGNGELGTLNTSSLQVSTVGTINGWPELTGTGTAQLWGFYPDANNPRVSQLDKTNGNEGTSFPLSALAGNPQAWAFAFWGGDFYAFTAPNNANSIVTRWRPTDDTVTQVATLPARIVGAGVSTCAPQ